MCASHQRLEIWMDMHVILTSWGDDHEKHPESCSNFGNVRRDSRILSQNTSYMSLARPGATIETEKGYK